MTHSPNYWHIIAIVLHLVFVISCNAQERPAFNTPTWEAGANHRNNFCERHEAVERKEIKLRDALRGLNITVAVFDYMLNQEIGAIDETDPYISFEILDELARRAGFTYRKSYGVVDRPTENTTWTDVLEWAVDTYDVMAEWYLQTTIRLEKGILFPEGWYNGNLILIMRANAGQQEGFDMWAFMLPFTLGAWISIAMITVVSGAIYYLLDYIDSRLMKKEMDIGFEESLFYAAFAFNGHYVHEPKTRSTRIFVFSMAFFFLLIVAAYTANLASFLVSKNQPKFVINNIDDAIRYELTICVWKNTGMDEHLQTYNIPFSRIHRTQDQGDEYVALQEGKCDILLTTDSDWELQRRDARYNPTCDLERVGSVVKFESAGFTMQDSGQYCTSLLRNAFHLHIFEMKAAHALEGMWNRVLNKGATKFCTANVHDARSDHEEYGRMGMSNLSGVFVWHLSALGAAIFWSFFRVWRQPTHRKTAMLKEIQEALIGVRGLTKAAASARLRKSIFAASFFRKSTDTSATARSSACEVETGSSKRNICIEGNNGFGGDHMPENKRVIFQHDQNLVDVPEHMETLNEDIEKTTKRYQEEIKRRDKHHWNIIETICKEHREKMEEKNYQHRIDIELICRTHQENMEKKEKKIEKLCRKHEEEMKNKDEKLKEFLVSLQKNQLDAIIDAINKKD